MNIKTSVLEVLSRDDLDMVDITPQVQQAVADSGIGEGMVFVMTAHTSAGIVVTEGIECLGRDMLAHLEPLAPRNPQAYTYWHNRYLDFDGRLGFNAGDHLKSLIAGYFAYFPVRGGKILKGSRQTIYFAEFDGPLARECVVQVIGI